MAMTLGAVTFDESCTTVREALEEAGGRDPRTVVLAGLILGEHAAADIEAKLDAIVQAAPEDGGLAALSVRTGRRLWVRRKQFKREIARQTLTGSFELTLEAEDPVEESIAEQETAWAIEGSGATLELSSPGTAPTRPRITLVAEGDVVEPAFSDGTRTVVYHGTVADGETLVLDGANGAATLEGADVLPYVTGLFPEVGAAATLTYTDGASSSHEASATVAYRDRWR